MSAPALRSVARPAGVDPAPVSQWLGLHPALGISPLDHLFNQFDGMFPNRWRPAFPNAQSVENWRETWAAAFEAERLTFREISVGLQETRRSGGDWPPSLGQFVAACRPALDPYEAYRAALLALNRRRFGEVGEWPNKAVYWASVAFGQGDMITKPYAMIEKAWRAALADKLGDANLPEIPQPMLALPDIGQGVTDKETARQNIRNVIALARRGRAA